MKKLNTKLFFINSIVIHFFLTIFVVLISWQFFEPNVYNFMHKFFTADKVGSDDIVLIVIDDKSIEKHRWPWKRDLYANIFEYINKYSKPQAIGFDAIISNLDKDNPESDQKLFNTLGEIDNFVAGFSPLTQEISNDNRDYFNKFNEKFAINIEDNLNTSTHMKYRSISKFPPEYFNSINYTGSVNATQYFNGYVTTSDQIVGINGIQYPSFALRIYLLINKTDKITINKNNILVDKTQLKIPITVTPDAIQSFLHFYKIRDNTEYSHKKYSAADILDSLDNMKKGIPPIIDPSEFNGKVVLVGANAKAAALGLEDALPTPMLQKHPGVDIQATNLDNLMHNQFIKQTTLKQDSREPLP